MPKRICLIVESPEHGSPVQPIDKLLEKVSPGDSVRIVWLIDAPVAPLKERLEQLGARTTVVMGEPLIQEAAASFSKDLVGILSQLRRVVGQRDFWMMRISEVSLGTRAWFEVVRAWAVTKQIEQHDSDLCLVAGGASMVKFVRLSARSLGADFVGRRVHGPARNNSLTRALGVRCLNFLRDWQCLRLTRRRRSSGETGVLVFTSFPNNWRGIGGPVAHLRYTGEISAALAEEGQRGTYVVTLTRRAMPGLLPRAAVKEALRQLDLSNVDMPVLMIESFGSLGDLIRTYLNPRDLFELIRARRRLARSRVYWGTVDISSVLARDLVSGFLIDLPTNRYLRTSFSRLVRAGSARALVVPGHELAEGRTVTSVANRSGLKTLGLQHGVHGAAHTWRFHLTPTFIAGRGPDEDAFVPSLVGVEGHVDRQRLVDVGFPESRVVVVGAARIATPPPSRLPDRAGSTRLVFLGDLPGPRAPDDPWWLGWCADPAFAGHEIVVRPHPTVADQSHSQAVAFEQRTGRRITEDLGTALGDSLSSYQPLIVFACVTGAVVETVFNGWPVAVIRSNWLPDCNPMTNQEQSGVFATANPETLADWLSEMSEPEVWNRYAESCFRVAAELVDTGGREAARRLVEALELNSPS